MAPHSRYTGISHEDVLKAYDDGLRVLCDSEKCGDVMLMNEDGSQFFVLCHLEYDRMTLDNEYKRDVAKGMDTQLPENYYEDDNPENKPLLKWRAHSDMMYSNWVNYYVYQETPYDINAIKKREKKSKSNFLNRGFIFISLWKSFWKLSLKMCPGEKGVTVRADFST